jgi:hypothetical protein
VLVDADRQRDRHGPSQQDDESNGEKLVHVQAPRVFRARAPRGAVRRVRAGYTLAARSARGARCAAFHILVPGRVESSQGFISPGMP